ncbi:inhibitor of Bruton tyrosine kinase [Anopheles marshallii]|uniref:inhibitor of Bruton tyrosine kinase n=1 Tax=Anopheles marshallii TaxID=1521116 RepID=UPI00237A3756|nr:inhibitor of Bruton tyrosine kinase [Anopheles marshallii]
MFTISDYDYECTKKCRLVSHGNAITAALTKRSISDELLAAYIAKTCRNFAHVVDEYGRSALHMAASVGRSAIVEWLINQGACLTQKDLESGHTALHRAMYYGSIGSAVVLVKHGAPLDAPDEDFVNPMQLCSNVSEQRASASDERSVALGPELMIWGQNKNYNLGIGNAQDKCNPESMEYFRKTRTTIRKLDISSYHSVFLTHKMGELFVAGHGVGGRLGLGMEDTIAYPMKVPVPLKDDERITDVTAAKHHTLILTDSNHIYACGENKHCQLGLKPPPPNLLTFKEITGQSSLSGKTINRVIAKDYHSIAVLDADIYVWGLNGGQFGLKRDSGSDMIVLPKPMPLIPERSTLKDDSSAVKRDTTIKLIESSNAAIVVYTMKHFLHIFSGFKVKTYKKPLLEKIECLSVTGGELQTGQDDVVKRSGDLRVIVFTASRNIYIWYEDCQQFVRCVFAQSRNLEVEKVRWCSQQHALVLLLGNLYQGIITNKLPRSAKHQYSEFKETYIRKELCDTLQSRIELRRVRNLSNVVDFTCDAEGENYAALVENTRRCFCIPELVESNYDYGTLLADATEMDGVHDVVLYVEHEPFASHRFILYHRSDSLRKLLQQFPTEKEFVLNDHGFESITIGAFRLIMRYFYTNQVIARADVDRMLRKPGTGEIGSNVDLSQLKTLCKKLKEQIDKFDLPVLSNSVKKLQDEPSIEPFPKLRLDSYPELYDITIELQDDKKLRAHKCVLVARLDYFNMMFAHCWTEKRTTADLRTVPREYMDVIIPFLYDNDYSRVRRQRYSENFILSMIIICDQFLIEELKSIFETILSQRVHLRNVGELLEFAYQYNCEVLKSVCMQFVSVNFARLLEWRLLDGLDPTMLAQIDSFYKEFFRLSEYRMITPFADAIGDEELEKFVSDFRVDLEQKATDQMNASDRPNMKHIPKTKQPNMPALSKLQREKRNYEKEAMAYLERLVLEEAAAVKERKISASKTANAASFSSPIAKVDSILDRSVINDPVGNKSWQTVSADSKRKTALSAALRANEVMKEEAKQPANESFSNLRTVLERSPTAPQLVPLRSPDEGYESSSNVARSATINLSDFTLTDGRLSQKERKRLNSEKSKMAKSSHQEINGQGQASDTTLPAPVNPWKNVENVPVVDLFKVEESSPGSNATASGRRQRKSSTNEQSKHSRADSDAFGSPSTSNTAGQNGSTVLIKSRERKSSSRYSGGEKDFNEILEDERRQKRYFEKIKSKSLIQTQIEERAIEELRAFYNVEHVFDESITIERYRPPLLENGPNFAVWQYQ